jgi:hypothetical protein
MELELQDRCDVVCSTVSRGRKEEMSGRHEAKKAYLQMKLLLKHALKTAPAAEKKELLAVERHLRNELLSITSEQIPSEVIQRRRATLESNSELKEIFSLFWLVLSVSTVEGVLAKDDYVTFHVLLQSALIGDAIDQSEARTIAEADYNYDTLTFGEITEDVFFDIMLSTIGTYLLTLPLSFLLFPVCLCLSLTEVWADMVSPKYHTAFAWALLASTVDVKSFPPIFHSKSSIRCITTVNSTQVTDFPDTPEKSHPPLIRTSSRSSLQRRSSDRTFK